MHACVYVCVLVCIRVYLYNSVHVCVRVWESLSPSLTLLHSLAFSLSHTHALSLSRSLTLLLPRSLDLSPSRTCSLPRAHTHSTHAKTLCHTRSITRRPFSFPPLTHLQSACQCAYPSLCKFRCGFINTSSKPRVWHSEATHIYIYTYI